MWGQRLSHTHRRHRPLRGVQAGAGMVATPVCDGQTGFLRHAAGFPLQYRRLRRESRAGRRDIAESGRIGLMFESDEYVKPGTVLEISIEMPLEDSRFRGRVVLVRHHGEHFQIGVWLEHAADASRMRIVEQMCHIEAYLKQRKFTDGPYSINRERLAAEWIAENAASVPGL